MCNEAVDDYVHTLDFVPDCYETHEMCNKVVNTYASIIQFIPEYYRT